MSFALEQFFAAKPLGTAIGGSDLAVVAAVRESDGTRGTLRLNNAHELTSAIADGSHATFGAKADAKSAATDATPVSAMSVWKQISFYLLGLLTGFGTAADAASTATDSTPASGVSVWKQVSKSAQAFATGLGTTADAASAATDATPASGISVWKQVSKSVQAFATGFGTTADAASTATDATPASGVSIWKQVSKTLQAIAAAFAAPAGVQIDSINATGYTTPFAVRGQFNVGLSFFMSAPANGTFDQDTDWTKGAGWTISGGVANAAGALSTAISHTLPALAAGETYTVTYTITRSAGTLQLSLGGGPGGAAQNASGTYTEQLVAGSGAPTVTFTGAGFTGTLDNVAFQALSATVYLQRMKPSESSFRDVTDSSGVAMQWTTSVNCTLSEPEAGVQYRHRVAYGGSGRGISRISQ